MQNHAIDIIAAALDLQCQLLHEPRMLAQLDTIKDAARAFLNHVDGNKYELPERRDAIQMMLDLGAEIEEFCEISDKSKNGTAPDSHLLRIGAQADRVSRQVTEYIRARNHAVACRCRQERSQSNN